MTVIKDFANTIGEDLTSLNKELEEMFLTGETNLVLTKNELEKKLLSLKNGKSYLGVLELEHRILEGQGVIDGYFKHGQIMFSIPDWDSFISRVNAFHVACGPY